MKFIIFTKQDLETKKDLVFYVVITLSKFHKEELIKQVKNDNFKHVVIKSLIQYLIFVL